MEISEFNINTDKIAIILPVLMENDFRIKQQIEIVKLSQKNVTTHTHLNPMMVLPLRNYK